MSSALLPSPDPTLAVAERQLLLLGELTEIAMVAARALGASAVAAARAEERVLADEYYLPEVGRARACGARDAAESLQKACRAARLTMKLEMAVAEVLRDIRAGVVTRTTAAWNVGAPSENASHGDGVRAGDAARSSAEDETSDRDRLGHDREHLVEFERPDALPRDAFRDTVERICHDLDITPEQDWWSGATGSPPDASFLPMLHRWSEAPSPPAGDSGPRSSPDEGSRALPPRILAASG